MYSAVARAETSNDIDMDDDNRLVREARKNPATFDALYERYLDRVYAYVRARTTSPEETADVTQQVFMQALDALPRYRGPSFAAWLFRIAHNVVADAHRHRRSHASWDSLPDHAQPSAPDDVETGVLVAETEAHLHHLISALPPDKRELLTLRYAAGLRTAEIAAVLGKTDAAVRQQLSRLVQKLQEDYDAR